ncbi:unnamed protein product, partial [Amoebophrya sp. A25]|eukprot:GSA25T00008742001.1
MDNQEWATQLRIGYFACSLRCVPYVLHFCRAGSIFWSRRLLPQPASRLSSLQRASTAR